MLKREGGHCCFLQVYRKQLPLDCCLDWLDTIHFPSVDYAALWPKPWTKPKAFFFFFVISGEFLYVFFLFVYAHFHTYLHTLISCLLDYTISIQRLSFRKVKLKLLCLFLSIPYSYHFNPIFPMYQVQYCFSSFVPVYLFIWSTLFCRLMPDCISELPIRFLVPNF